MNFKIIDMEAVKKLYIEEGYSASELAKIFNVTTSTIIKKMRKYGIDTRSSNNYLTTRISKKIKQNQIGQNNSNYKEGSWKISGTCENWGIEFEVPRSGRKSVRFCSNKCAHEKMGVWNKGISGKDAHNWKEDKKTPFRKSLRYIQEYKEWRTANFERDNYTCQLCGKIGGYLEVHHKNPFANILDIYKIENYDEALMCTELWDIDNGVTYCVKCHAIVDEQRNI